MANTSSTSQPFDVDAATERIRSLNETVLEAAKKSGMASLEAYENTLTELANFEQQVAGATQLDWLSALAKAHATFMTEVTQAYTNAARDALNK
jgi:hypothetical protein